MLSAKWIPYIIVAIIFSYNPPWPILGFSSELGILLSLLLILGTKRKRIRVLYPKHYLSLISLFVFFIITHLFSSISYSYFIYIGVFYYCYRYLEKEDTQTAIKLITKILSIVLGISLTAWLIHSNYFSFPCIGYIDLSSGKGADAIMSNYLFFVQSENHIDFVNRFYSIFDEPGVVGTLSAFVLFANKYDFKNNKQLLIILIAAFFTFSLAFYVLTTIGYIYIVIKYKRINISTIVLIATAGIILSLFIIQLEEFDLILKSRLDEGIGSSLESRTSDNINSFYEKAKWSIDWLLGFGKDGIIKRGLTEGSSYKLFIIREGFLSLIVLMFSYYSIIRKRNIDTLAFFIFFWLSFLQRPSAMNAGFILIYAICIACFEKETKGTKQKLLKI